MSETTKRDTELRRYLLGALDEDDKARMEEAFFADDTKFEAIEIAEDELIDAYIRNDLSGTEEAQFRARLVASPRLVERVHFARALAQKADSFSETEVAESIPRPVPVSSAKPKPKHRWLAGLFAQQPAFATPLAVCAILILVAGVVLISRFRSESVRREAERAAVQRQKDEADKLAREQQAREAKLAADKQAKDQRPEDPKSPDESQPANKVKEPPTPQPRLSTVATVLLMPGSLRGGGSQSILTIGPGTTTARIQIALATNEHPTYIVTIKPAEDETGVFRRIRLKSPIARSAPYLFLSLPSKDLISGAYIVHLDGLTPSGQMDNLDDYSFQVVK